MNVLVIQSGICDPKWPLPSHIDEAALDAHAAAHVLSSPFDEAALEVALKLRDEGGAPPVRVDVLACGGESIARTAAGLRVDSVQCVSAGGVPAWDTRARASAIARVVSERRPRPDLVLLGREFGDFDDGGFAAALAQLLGMRFAGLCWSVQAGVEGRVRALRQRGARTEWVSLDLPAVVSVTNHTHNRLRHPLLKNVMLARKMKFDEVVLTQDVPTLALQSIAAAAPMQRAGECRMLAGTPLAQAETLARLLLEAAP